MADQRILRGVAATLSFTNVDQDGVAAAASGAVTVGVMSSDGSTVVAPGSATVGANPYTKALTAAQTASLDILTATWTDAGDGSVHTTTAEIVGGFHFSIAELRAQKNLADTSKFTNAELVAVREWWETLSESYCDQSFVPRYKVRRLSGTGGGTLSLPEWNLRSVRRVWVYSDADTYVAFTPDELADITPTSGTLHSRSGYFTYGDQNIVVAYEHGLDTAPADIRQAGLEACRHRLLDQQQGPVVYSVADGEGGVTRFAMPGADRPTGIPSVDTVLNRYRYIPVGG